MKKYQSKFAPLIALIVVSTGILVPLFHAQSLGGTVTVSTVPDGADFNVDGQNYNHAMSAVWPPGSKHTLSVTSALQDGGGTKTRYNFNGWSYANGALQGNTVVVTADPAFTYYRASFDLQYALTVVMYNCSTSPIETCSPPGQILFNGGQGVSTSQDIYLSANASVKLTAQPNPGWVFVGWNPGPNQTISGTTNTVVLHGPVTVYPIFKQAKTINLLSDPIGLELLADRTKVPTPNSLEWGYATTHTLGVITPQLDNAGKWWSFQSWSDGGASTHSYTTDSTQQPATVTAKFVPGAATLLTTTPAGLSLNVDGRSNYNSYQFIWGVGETHHLEAPAQQTDSQGRVWKFSSWSNGGAAAQDYTVPPIAGDNGVRLNATYTPVGHLIVTSSLPSLTVQVDGTDCPTPCDVQRPVGTPVRVTTATSIPLADGIRADFQGWPGSGSTSSDWSVTLGSDPITLNAGYRVMNRLANYATPPEGATWSMSPASNDGYYEPLTIVNLAVVAKPGYRFHAWSGDLSGTKPVGSVAMNAPRSVQAQLDRVPYIAPTGVSNAAGETPVTGLAAGSVASIFGASFTTDTVVGPANPLAQTLGGVTVKTGDRFLPLFFVSPAQINVQIPDDLAMGTQTLTVSSQGLPDVQATFNVVRDAPGVFAALVKDQIVAMAVHEDGSPVTPDAPALHGELLTLYGTGFGPTDHNRLMGFAIPSNPPYLILDAPTVMVGDVPLAAQNAFAVPGRIAIDAVQFRLDDTAPSGTTATVHVLVNGQDSNTVKLPIQ